ncbi:MAG: M42 family metallopeptidase [Candidatus Hodarchaeota archaeon]
MYPLVFKKKGTSEAPKVLIAGHADEVGFITKGSEKGYLSFIQLGGWWDQSLLTQRVLVRTRKGDLIPGVIVGKSSHLLSAEERSKVVTKEQMFLDVGCASNEEVKELGIRMGDPIIPDSKFKILKRKRIKKKDNGEIETQDVTLALGKDFDDRIGAYIAIEVLKRIGSDHPNTFFGAATTQEEIGLRRAHTTAYLVKPEVAIAMETDISGDVPGISEVKAPAKMSEGCSILTYNTAMIPNTNLLNFAIDNAENEGIKYQLSQITGGRCDAAEFHKFEKGCPSLVIGIPTRHIHSHNSILDLDDVEQTSKLCTTMVKKLDEETVASFTRI